MRHHRHRRQFIAFASADIARAMVLTANSFLFSLAFLRVYGPLTAEL